MVPQTALNLSRGCGNPTGFANIRPGEVVLDFGCGGGIDVILAAHKVGPLGTVVGIDFAPQMIERARQAVADAGLQDRNIEFCLARMDMTGIADGFADVVVSNCVVNLCPDKDAVYKEAFRTLRPGGRLAISDIVLTDDIDPQLRNRFQSNWAGCLGGALGEDAYWRTVVGAGFAAIRIVTRHLLTPEELEAMACCPGKEFTAPQVKEDLAVVQGRVASLKFTAVKPSSSVASPCHAGWIGM
ncbi:MAG: methyltransferase domain-containing protein [Chloroflexi bacterium]|nr:methyltransferase domain-containing protein [Chloroflexota bacterium]